MLKISKVLFPTDFSPLSEEALRYALQFADDYKATLHVVHVVDEAYQYWMNMAPNTMPVTPISDDVLKQSAAALDRFVNEKIPEPRRAATVREVLAGRPYLEIINYARTQAIDLIVIGTHGRGGISHMLLGSVAEKVVRKAPCPVLTVHHPEHELLLP